MAEQFGQPGDHRVRLGAVERGHVGVRHQNRAHARALSAVNVVIRPVADEDAGGGIGHPDSSHRGPERLRMRLHPLDLAAVDGAVDQVEDSSLTKICSWALRGHMVLEARRP